MLLHALSAPSSCCLHAAGGMCFSLNSLASCSIMSAVSAPYLTPSPLGCPMAPLARAGRWMQPQQVLLKISGVFITEQDLAVTACRVALNRRSKFLNWQQQTTSNTTWEQETFSSALLTDPFGTLLVITILCALNK